MKDEYWKKRYEKLIEMIQREHPIWDINEWRTIVEEEIEAEEIEHEAGMVGPGDVSYDEEGFVIEHKEGTVEDAKVRKVTRHDRP